MVVARPELRTFYMQTGPDLDPSCRTRPAGIRGDWAALWRCCWVATTATCCTLLTWLLYRCRYLRRSVSLQESSGTSSRCSRRPTAVTHESDRHAPATSSLGYFRIFAKPPGGAGARSPCSGALLLFWRTLSSTTRSPTRPPRCRPQVTVFDNPGQGDLDWMVADCDIDIVWENTGTLRVSSGGGRATSPPSVRISGSETPPSGST